MKRKRQGRGMGPALVMFAVSSLMFLPLSAKAEEAGSAPAVIEVAAQEEAAKLPETITETSDMPLPETEEKDLSGLSEEEKILYLQLEEIVRVQNGQVLVVDGQIAALTAEGVVLDEAQTQMLGQLQQLRVQLQSQIALQEEQLALMLENAALRQTEQEQGPAIIFVGDSRFVQMKNAVGANEYVWIAKSSQGYQWFSEEAIPQIDAAVGYGTKILLNLGVNDVANVNAYAKLVNAKAEEWIQKGAQVYYSSVNPVEDGRYVTREMVRSFNEKLRTRLDPQIVWIDSYSYLQNAGYTLTDGVHFSNGTYKKLYQYYLSLLAPE